MGVDVEVVVEERDLKVVVEDEDDEGRWGIVLTLRLLLKVRWRVSHG